MNLTKLLRLACLSLSVAVAIPAPLQGQVASNNRVSIATRGAVSDGKTLNTDKIQATIDELASSGGGTLVVPRGTFLSGALFLKPGVNLHLEKGGVLKCSTDMANFPPRRTRIEGHFEESWSPALINADGCDGLRITGGGTLDGDGQPLWDHFWKLRKAADPKNFISLSVPRARLCFIQNSKGIEVSGVTFKDSQFWNLHLYNCQDVVVENCRFEIPDGATGPSTDGVDIDSSQNIVVRGCYFSVNDDCVALKGNRHDGLNQEPKSPPVRNVLVENCTFVRGHGALTLGTEAQSISEVEMKECVVKGNMPMLRLKLRSDTSNQDYRHVRIRNIQLEGSEGEIVRVYLYYGPKVPTLKAPISKVSDIVIENVSGSFGSFGTLFGGTVATVRDVTFRNVHVTVAKDSELNTNGVAGVKFEDVSVQKAQLPKFNNAAPSAESKFEFSSYKAQPGYIQVAPEVTYDGKRGFGFLESGALAASNQPAVKVFAVDVAEGNYDVTMRFGDPTNATSTTIKAESRRLMIEKVETSPGEFVTRTFTVNVRKPALSTGGMTKLNQRESGPPASPNWDEYLSVEFNGSRPGVVSMEIKPATNAVTIYLAGDSTVTDQWREPWAGWGQMLPRFFEPGVALSNQAESGLALSSFERQRRLEKILSTMKAGDYLFIQFGHNDQKDTSAGAGPFTTYKANLKRFVAAARSKGGIPVLVTPMERLRMDEQGNQTPTLDDYAEAVRQVGAEDKVPVIDLNAMSLKLYGALGPQRSTKAFVFYPANTFPGHDMELKDRTHHNAYGGYELARCVVEGIRASVPELATHLAKEVGTFDPANPDPPEKVVIPASPLTGLPEKPDGS